MTSSARESVLAAALASERPRFRSRRTAGFVESVIREMTRLALARGDAV
ncbi:MAG: hypothetical protein HYZ57_10670, partial [Acidobacteria bacterium]|nr:hypothetical protein [Acidobacteriota bacterium]